MGEITQLFSLTPRTVRFYEERGLITSVRDGLNHRRYDQSARLALELISRMRRAGLSIPEIQKLMETRAAGDDLVGLARQLVRARRAALRRQLAELEATDGWLESLAPTWTQAAGAS